MSALHAATSGPLVKELVAAVLEEFDVWSEFAVNQAAGLHPRSPRDAATSALYEVRSEISDHLQIRLAVLLATYEVDS